jgi:predicted TIM-barrel fold metal-dependent hydrolase
VDNILFESDYPHSDCNWPHTRKMLGDALADVPDDEARKIVELNARALYHFSA